ncbi:MAG: CHAT domain-containing protein [Candidatus Accumulibacter cognatus]|uniref:CHAT domain-containing protein n=1 Tax=Candidatus Accumulibacter cognatus TaxID=2954383 RepID=A0A7D5NFW4_9PROT|nr:MAG: CHAT domain-containing protein [Candidatus Accumulibacter cognatus]
MHQTNEESSNQGGRPEQAIADYSAALQRFDASGLDWASLSGDERALLLRALVDRGFTHGQSGRPEQAIDDYSAALQRFDASGLDWASLSGDERNILAFTMMRLIVSFADGASHSQASIRLLKALDGDVLRTWKYGLPSIRIVHWKNVVTACERWLLAQGETSSQLGLAHLRRLACVFVQQAFLRRRSTLERLHTDALARSDEMRHLVREHLGTQSRITERADELQRAIEAGKPWSGLRAWRHWRLRHSLRALDRLRRECPLLPTADELWKVCWNCARPIANEVMARHEFLDGPKTSGEILLAGVYWAARPRISRTARPWETGAEPWRLNWNELAALLKLDDIILDDQGIVSRTVRSHDWWLSQVAGAAVFALFPVDASGMEDHASKAWNELIDAWCSHGQEVLISAIDGAWHALLFEANTLLAKPAQSLPSALSGPVGKLTMCLKSFGDAEHAPDRWAKDLEQESLARSRRHTVMPVYRAPTRERPPLRSSDDLFVNQALHALAGGTVRHTLSEAIAAYLFQPFARIFAEPEIDGESLTEALGMLPDRVWKLLESPQQPARLHQILHTMMRTQVLATAQGIDSDINSSSTAQLMEDLWMLLETGRIALAGLRAPAASFELNDAAIQRLMDRLTKEFTRVKTALDLVARGEALPAGPGRAVFPPFECLDEEYTRAGIRLPLPTYTDCARQLAADEILVQVFFDVKHRARALILDAAGKLRLLRLPESVAALAWANLEDCWSNFYACSFVEEADEWFYAHHKAWHAFVAADGPAVSLLTSLVAADPAARRWRLLLPANLARLPWLGWVGSEEAASLPEVMRQKGALSLDACLSAWQRLTGEAQGEHRPQVMVESLREWPELAALALCEARLIGRHLKSEVLMTEDARMSDAVAMLQEDRPVHWVVHGEYRAHDPLGSFVRLNGCHGVRELPAWLIGAHDCRSPVALSSCFAMLVGGEAGEPLLGPVGLGPVLRTKGAPYVVGPLWESVMLASAVFYDLFYSSLTAVGAHTALTQAMSALRVMDAPTLRAWANDHGELVIQVVDEWINFVNSRGMQGPFSHPALWAQFSMLGTRECER